MPVILQTAKLKYKQPDSNEYSDINVISNESANAYVATVLNAATTASRAATLANNAANLANRQASLANEKATQANLVINKINNMQIMAEAVEYDENLTASLSTIEIDGNPAYQLNLSLPKGPKGDTGNDGANGQDGAQGEAGQPFKIVKSYSSLSDLQNNFNVDAASGNQFNEGDYIIVSDDAESENAINGKGNIYCIVEDTSTNPPTYTYRYIANVLGPKGANGIQGSTPVLNGVNVTMLEQGATASGNFTSGQNDEITLNLSIPRIGEKGDTGAPAYIHIKYAEDQPVQDSDMKSEPDDWIGIYGGNSATAPTTYNSYTWFKIKGAKGDTGNIGATGATGATGAAAYIYIKYAENQPTSNSDMKENPDNWIGIYSGAAAQAPDNYTDYTWFKIKGATGSIPQFTIGSVTSLTSDSSPTVSINNTDIANPILSFGIPTWKSLKIEKVYNSVSEMNSDYSSTDVAVGEFVMIGNVSDTNYSHIYLKLQDSTQKFLDLGKIEGSTGEQGVSVTDFEVSYASSNSSSIVPSTFENSLSNITITEGDYLWTRMRAIFNTSPATYSNYFYNITKQGSTGAQGPGIIGTEIKYQYGSSQTTVPSSTWSSNIPSSFDDSIPYLWTQIRLQYANNTYSDPIHLVAGRGAVGATGATGSGISNVSYNNSTGALTLSFTGGLSDFTTGDLRGQSGQGVPSGGTANQVLIKNSSTDYDATWSNLPSGGINNSGIVQLTSTINDSEAYATTPKAVNTVKTTADSALTAANSKVAMTSISTTLLSNEWSIPSGGSYLTQVITNNSITANNTVLVAPAGNITPAALTALSAGQIVCYSQANGSLTFRAYGTQPTENIPISIAVFD